MSKKIIIADDHELFSSGLKSLLGKNPDYWIDAHFKNGRELCDYFEQGGKTDVLILDLHMPVMDGVQFLNFIQRKRPEIKVLIVSMNQTASTVALCKTLGAKGFVSKDSNLHTLSHAVEAILEGEEFFMQPVESGKTVAKDGFLQRLVVEYNLSKREVDIIQLILNQYEGNEIAEKLNLSPLTVKTYRKNIFRKLGVRNLTGLVSLMREVSDF